MICFAQNFKRKSKSAYLRARVQILFQNMCDVHCIPFLIISKSFKKVGGCMIVESWKFPHGNNNYWHSNEYCSLRKRVNLALLLRLTIKFHWLKPTANHTMALLQCYFCTYIIAVSMFGCCRFFACAQSSRNTLKKSNMQNYWPML